MSKNFSATAPMLVLGGNMNFLISIILTALLIFIGRKFIKKHSILCYIVTGIISLLIIIASYSGAISSFPPFIKNNIIYI